MTAKQARTIEELQAATKAALQEGWKLVPVEPTAEQFVHWMFKDLGLIDALLALAEYEAKVAGA
jgi:hypothetical protein